MARKSLQAQRAKHLRDLFVAKRKAKFLPDGRFEIALLNALIRMARESIRMAG